MEMDGNGTEVGPILDRNKCNRGFYIQVAKCWIRPYLARLAITLMAVPLISAIN